MADLVTPVDGHAEGAGTAFLLTSPTTSRVVLSGELDAGLSSMLTEVTREAQRRGLPVQVDTRDVTFMDSSAMAMLARLAYQIPQRMTFIRPPDVVRFLLEVTTIDELVDVVEEDPGLDAELAEPQFQQASALPGDPETSV